MRIGCWIFKDIYVFGHIFRSKLIAFPLSLNIVLCIGVFHKGVIYEKMNTSINTDVE